ncbi:protein phosphatase 2C domain-containing protein [Nostoc sp. XA013]|nr:protein phosphatase 2C domain-containing protein [Nostoc sp. XA013]
MLPIVFLLLNPQKIVGAVADGAGSAKYSDVGSKLAVETVLKCFSEINEYPQKQAFSQPLSKEEAEEVFAKIVNKVITELQKQADERDYSVNDLACTLLIFVANSDCVAAMQIGDGFIVMRSQESEYQLLFQPDKDFNPEFLSTVRVEFPQSSAYYKPLIIYTGLVYLWFDFYHIIFYDRSNDLQPIRV